MRELPGINLDPLPEPDGKPGPYASSAVRTITGTRRNRHAVGNWYSGNAQLLGLPESPVVSCFHPMLEAWAQAVGGFDSYWSCPQPAPEDLPLSSVVPRVALSKGFPEWKLPQASYWIDYLRLTGRSDRLPEGEKIQRLRSLFPEGSTLILGNIGPSALRFSWWAMRHEFWDSELVSQFDAVVGPDFSSYLDDPRPQALIGERLTQLFSQMGAQAGKTVIPTVSWQNSESLARQADRLGAIYPDLHTIHLELGSKGADRAAWLFSRLDDIERYLAPLPLRLLVSGSDPAWFIGELRQVIPPERLCLVALNPFMQTTMRPLLPEQKANDFRRRLARLEELLSGELEAPVKTRPEQAAILLKEIEQQES